jgi:ZIP family zinc transporter
MLLATFAAGACIPLGGALARVERIQPQWLEKELRHSIIAFGGGVLLAAVALVLVPQGLRQFPSTAGAGAVFLLGGLVFFVLERHLAKKKHDAPLVSAMLLDYVPESIALGGMFAAAAPQATLLAVLIGLQNLPEGFNAYRELVSARSRGRNLPSLLMVAAVPIGPLMGVTGWAFGPGHPQLIGALMLFASGGILYLTFQDIAPQSRLARHWGPALGAVLGFAVGMIGQMLVGA